MAADIRTAALPLPPRDITLHTCRAHQRHAGSVPASALASWRAEREFGVRYRCRGFEACGSALPGSGDCTGSFSSAGQLTEGTRGRCARTRPHAKPWPPRKHARQDTDHRPRALPLDHRHPRPRDARLLIAHLTPAPYAQKARRTGGFGCTARPTSCTDHGRRSVDQAGPPRSTATNGSGVTGKYRRTT